jgi:hypothetical protein
MTNINYADEREPNYLNDETNSNSSKFCTDKNKYNFESQFNKIFPEPTISHTTCHKTSNSCHDEIDPYEEILDFKGRKDSIIDETYRNRVFESKIFKIDKIKKRNNCARDDGIRKKIRTLFKHNLLQIIKNELETENMPNYKLKKIMRAIKQFLKTKFPYDQINIALMQKAISKKLKIIINWKSKII